MDNTEYIKSLEERIEKLEKLFSEVKLENGGIVLNSSENITFSNCQLQAIALEKCKGVSVQHTTAETFGFVSLSAKIEHANIRNFENKSNKTKMSNCTIDNNKGE